MLQYPWDQEDWLVQPGPICNTFKNMFLTYVSKYFASYYFIQQSELLKLGENQADCYR